MSLRDSYTVGSFETSLGTTLRVGRHTQYSIQEADGWKVIFSIVWVPGEFPSSWIPRSPGLVVTQFSLNRVSCDSTKFRYPKMVPRAKCVQQHPLHLSWQPCVVQQSGDTGGLAAQMAKNPCVKVLPESCRLRQDPALTGSAAEPRLSYVVSAIRLSAD